MTMADTIASVSGFLCPKTAMVVIKLPQYKTQLLYHLVKIKRLTGKFAMKKPILTNRLTLLLSAPLSAKKLHG